MSFFGSCNGAAVLFAARPAFHSPDSSAGPRFEGGEGRNCDIFDCILQCLIGFIFTIVSATGMYPVILIGRSCYGVLATGGSRVRIAEGTYVLRGSRACATEGRYLLVADVRDAVGFPESTPRVGDTSRVNTSISLRDASRVNSSRKRYQVGIFSSQRLDRLQDTPRVNTSRSRYRVGELSPIFGRLIYPASVYVSSGVGMRDTCLSSRG